jgi:hypothetical protein
MSELNDPSFLSSEEDWSSSDSSDYSSDLDYDPNDPLEEAQQQVGGGGPIICVKISLDPRDEIYHMLNANSGHMYCGISGDCWDILQSDDKTVTIPTIVTVGDKSWVSETCTKKRVCCMSCNDNIKWGGTSYLFRHWICHGSKDMEKGKCRHLMDNPSFIYCRIHLNGVRQKLNDWMSMDATIVTMEYFAKRDLSLFSQKVRDSWFKK